MIDLHTHSIFSDGVLIPSELARRAQVLGVEAIGITDHADASNLDFIIPRIAQVAHDLNGSQSVKVIPGIELTHVPPELIEYMTSAGKTLEYFDLPLQHVNSQLLTAMNRLTDRSAIERLIETVARLCASSTDPLMPVIVCPMPGRASDVPEVVILPLSELSAGSPRSRRLCRAVPSILLGEIKMLATPRFIPPCACISASPDVSS